MTDSELKAIRERAEAATSGPWKAGGNFQFYVDLRKPSPSLSKHDLKRPTYWRFEDAVFVLAARQDIPILLDEIERLKEYEWKYKELCK